jgi:hypothetical protein
MYKEKQNRTVKEEESKVETNLHLKKIIRVGSKLCISNMLRYNVMWKYGRAVPVQARGGPSVCETLRLRLF